MIHHTVAFRIILVGNLDEKISLEYFFLQVCFLDSAEVSYISPSISLPPSMNTSKL